MKTATVVSDTNGYAGTGNSLGKSDGGVLSQVFPASPFPAGSSDTGAEIDEEDIKHMGRAALSGDLILETSVAATVGVADGVVTDSSAYWGTNDGISLNYGGEPDGDGNRNGPDIRMARDPDGYNTIAGASNGTSPGTPFIPNIASPGETGGTGNSAGVTNMAASSIPAVPSQMLDENKLAAPTSQYGSTSTEWSAYSEDAYPLDPKVSSRAIADQDFSNLTSDSSV